MSKLAELKDSAGGYDWAWQKETKALQEKAEALEGVGLAQEDRDAKAALKLSMDNILMVSHHPRQDYVSSRALFGLLPLSWVGD